MQVIAESSTMSLMTKGMLREQLRETQTSLRDTQIALHKLLMLVGSQRVLMKDFEVYKSSKYDSECFRVIDEVMPHMGPCTVCGTVMAYEESIIFDCLHMAHRSCVNDCAKCSVCNHSTIRYILGADPHVEIDNTSMSTQYNHKAISKTITNTRIADNKELLNIAPSSSIVAITPAKQAPTCARPDCVSRTPVHARPTCDSPRGTPAVEFMAQLRRQCHLTSNEIETTPQQDEIIPAQSCTTYESVTTHYNAPHYSYEMGQWVSGYQQEAPKDIYGNPEQLRKPYAEKRTTKKRTHSHRVSVQRPSPKRASPVSTIPHQLTLDPKPNEDCEDLSRVAQIVDD